ncbi:hypothetical protein ACEPAH_2886 [Sanghuangporus vaninii]
MFHGLRAANLPIITIPNTMKRRIAPSRSGKRNITLRCLLGGPLLNTKIDTTFSHILNVVALRRLESLLRE